jgi:hypothetical protein
MALENWIDTLCDAWVFDAENLKTVKSFRLISGTTMPAAITPANDYPCAVTIPFGMQTGVDGVDIYKGITQFYVAPNKDMNHIPAMMKWFRLIKDAWLNAGLTLGGTVEYFIIAPDENAVSGPISLQYSEGSSPCWGFTVEWIVKERTAVTVKP